MSRESAAPAFWMHLSPDLEVIDLVPDKNKIN